MPKANSRMGPIRLIRAKVDLSGTCYFEFLPGEFVGKCWNEQSVFLSEEVFGLLEPMIARHEPRFDHYAFLGIGRATWEPIIAELEDMSSTAGGVAGVEVVALAGELAAWLNETLTHFECVSILGM